MNNQGKINPSVLLELFQELGASHKIIQLNFMNDDGQLTQLIYKEGHLVYVPLEHHKSLEIFLIGEGVLTLEQVEELIKYKKESGLPLEQLIVQADILNEEQLKKVWEKIARDFVLTLFTYENGEYNSKELPNFENNHPAIFPLSSLGECEEEIFKMMEAISTLGGLKSIYKLANNSSYLNIENVSEECRKHFQSSIDGKNTISDILNWSFFTVSKTLQILNDLKNKNSISLASGNAPDPVTADDVIQKEKAKEKVPDAELSTDTPLPTTGNFSGSLSVLSLVEVLQTLNNARRTGVLTLDIKDGPAILNLLNGEIVGVTFGGLKNKDAFYKLVTIRKGEFYFESNQGSFSKEMDIPTMSLLMEAMRLTDEGPKQNTDDILGKSFEEQPMSSRVLKRKESKASFLIKLILFLGIVIYFLAYYFIYKPSKEKELLFAKQKIEVESLINTQKYSQALDSWNKFFKVYIPEHPDWESGVNLEKDLIITKIKDDLKLLIKEIEKTIKSNDYSKSLSNLNKLDKIISNLTPELQKKFVKEREFWTKNHEIVVNQQKELDYNNWKINFESNLTKLKGLLSDFEHEEAQKIIKTAEQNLDQTKDKALYAKLVQLKKIVSDREEVITNSQTVINDKNATFPQKVEAYEKIIESAGVKKPRGIQANKQLVLAKEKMSSFENKLRSILLTHSKDSVAKQIVVIEQLQKDVSSKEELQFLENEKEKIIEMNRESAKLHKDYVDLISKKDNKNAFLVCRKIFDKYAESDIAKQTNLPFFIDNQPGIQLSVNGTKVELPYKGEIGINQVIKIQADKKGCKAIAMTLDKNLKNYDLEFAFIMAELWSVEFKGELNISPEICLSGKGILVTNHTDLELIHSETGSKIWRRQINNPMKPFKKSNGNKVIIGDDEFWKLDSEISVFENYIGICSKNSEINVLIAEDGNNVVKHEMGYYSKSAPMIIRSTLLGNKAFVYSGTIEGDLTCVALEDQSVRLEEKLGDSNNAILGVYPLNEHFFVAILEQNIKCFSLSTSKLKWSKNMPGKVKNVYPLNGKIYVRLFDGLMEITENSETWKLISYPARDVKEMVYNRNGILLISGGKSYYLDDVNGRFLPIGLPLTENTSLFSNGKYFEIIGSQIRCYQVNNPKFLWETEKVGSPIKMARTVDSYLLYTDGSKLHAILLGN